MVQTNCMVNAFELGETVHLVSGVNEGDRGMITNIDLSKQTAQVFSLTSYRPFTCTLDELAFLSSGSVPVIPVGKNGLIHSVGDIVILSTGEVGVVVQVNPNGTVRILTTENQEDTVPVAKIASKRNRLCSNAVDKEGHTVAVEDSVVLHNQRTGRVVHIWKSKLFVKVPSMMESNGFVVVESSHTRVVGGGAPIQGHSGPMSGGGGGRGGFGQDRGRGGQNPRVSARTTVAVLLVQRGVKHYTTQHAPYNKACTVQHSKHSMHNTTQHALYN
eukprot:Lankesteria_metandrocarpae@DN5323_c0_g1_i1.p1